MILDTYDINTKQFLIHHQFRTDRMIQGSLALFFLFLPGFLVLLNKKGWKAFLNQLPVVNIWSSLTLSTNVARSRIEVDNLEPRDGQIQTSKEASSLEKEIGKFIYL